MKLKDYLASKSITAAEFGRRIKVSQAAVTRYAAGDRIPEPGVMRRIARITGGIVSPNDFYDVFPARRKAAPTRLQPGLMEESAEWRPLPGEPHGNRRDKANPKAIKAWNEWIEENGLPFAELRPW
jgi:transcriptional regulator with XRE-family HTH domain